MKKTLIIVLFILLSTPYVSLALSFSDKDVNTPVANSGHSERNLGLYNYVLEKHEGYTRYDSLNIHNNRWHHGFFLGLGIPGMHPSRHCPPTPTPVPAAVWLLGTGIVGLLGVKRKFNL